VNLAGAPQVHIKFNTICNRSLKFNACLKCIDICKSKGSYFLFEVRRESLIAGYNDPAAGGKNFHYLYLLYITDFLHIKSALSLIGFKHQFADFINPRNFPFE
jgi:hypothetical protein